MLLRNLEKENENYEEEQLEAIFFGAGTSIFNFSNPNFKSKWLDATFTLKEWMSHHSVDYLQIEAKAQLTRQEKERIQKRKEQHYKWLLEYKLQFLIRERLEKAISTPKYALQFANEELDKIAMLKSNNYTNEETKEYIFHELHLTGDLDLLTSIEARKEKAFIHQYDIHDSNLFYYDLIELYEQSIQEFIKDGGIIEWDYDEFDDEFPYKITFKELLQLCNNIIVKYKDYRVFSVSECTSPTELHLKIETVANSCIEKLINKIKYIPLERRLPIVEKSILIVSELKDTFIEGSQDFTGMVPQSYKILTNFKYEGNIDAIVAMDFQMKHSLQFELRYYIEKYFEAIESAVRSIEHVKNNLQLIKYTQEKALQQSQEVYSFEYTNNEKNPFRINHLFNSLKEKGLISQDSRLLTLKRIFTGKKTSTPLIWTGTISELSYFIKTLIEKGKIKGTKNKHWDITIQCFIKPDQTRFERNKLRTSQRPATYSTIHNLVAIL